MSIVLPAQAADGPTLAQLSRQEDCPYVRLDDPGGPMANVPTFDQADGENCWAHAGATLLSTMIASSGATPPTWTQGSAISPMDLTFQEIIASEKNGARNSSYIEVKRKGHHKGGDADIEDTPDSNVCDVIEAEEKVGACDITRSARLSSGQNEAVGRFDVTAIATLREKINELISLRSGTEFEAVLKGVVVDAKLASCLRGSELDSALSGLESNLRAIVKVHNKNTVEQDMQALASILNVACAPRSALPSLPACHVLPFTDNYEVANYARKQKLIAQSLTGPKPLPVGIGYCGTMLDGASDYVGMLVDQKGGNITKPDCGGHASVLIGQRWNAHPAKGAPRCEYLIRNSWGKDCDGYADGIDCDSKQGDVWLDANHLIYNIDEMQVLGGNP